MEEAQRRAPVQTFVERFARIYARSSRAGLLVTVVHRSSHGGEFREWFYRALVLLVIACPWPQ